MDFFFYRKDAVEACRDIFCKKRKAGYEAKLLVVVGWWQLATPSMNLNVSMATMNI